MSFLRLLRVSRLLATVVGAAGSLGFMFRVGHRNQSQLLLAPFTVWVLSPFAALSIANVVARHRQVCMQVICFILTVIITFGSLAIYGEVAFGPRPAQPASAFVVVPPVSMALIAAALAIAARLGRHRSDT